MRFLLSFLVAFAFVLVGCGPKYPNCKTDEDCKERSEVCVNEKCVQCRDANDCDEGFDCKAGMCERAANYCEGAEDCDGECVNHRCQKNQSTDEGDKVGLEAEGCNLTNVYFSFDDDTLSQSARDAIQANAHCISKTKVVRLLLTGHTDPQGSEEYNLALGHRRAESVRKFLESLGVTVEITVTSAGEEQSTEDSAKFPEERRVDIKERN